MKLANCVALCAALVLSAAFLGCNGGDSSKPVGKDKGAGAKATGEHDDGHEHEDDGHAHEGEGAGHEHADGHSHGGNTEEMKARVSGLESYDAAMQHIEQLRGKISDLIQKNELGKVHPPAEEISLTARRLPELASKSDIPKDKWKEITTLSRDLANLFSEIDQAADAGKKKETEAAFAKMQELIDGLQSVAAR